MDQIIAPRARGLLVRTRREADLEMGRASQCPNIAKRRYALEHRCRIGSRIRSSGASAWVKDMPLEMVFKHLSLNELYRLSWGAKNAHGADWEKLKGRVRSKVGAHEQGSHQGRLAQNRRPYMDISPASPAGDDLIIYNPDTINTASPDELTRLACPRQPYDDHLCLADYFTSTESGRWTWWPFQVVTTAGSHRTIRQAPAAGDYSEAYFIHGLAVQTAEATADYLHGHIRRRLGLGEEQGNAIRGVIPPSPTWRIKKGVSFDARRRKRTRHGSLDAYQLIPEQSTAAIIVPS